MTEPLHVWTQGFLWTASHDVSMHVSRLIYLTCLDVGSDMHLPLDSLNWLLQVMVTCLNSPTTYTPLPRCNNNKSIGSSLPAFLQAAARPGIGEIMTKCRKRSQSAANIEGHRQTRCMPSMHQLYFRGRVKKKNVYCLGLAQAETSRLIIP
uniref:Uncharacterized protein n=1 Tax=Photinus pyralis TaxID=7054 RepID=A0A1Y1LSY4_PHOPY